MVIIWNFSVIGAWEHSVVEILFREWLGLREIEMAFQSWVYNSFWNINKLFYSSIQKMNSGLSLLKWGKNNSTQVTEIMIAMIYKVALSVDHFRYLREISIEI